jgi:hypothetical protein
MFPRYNAYCAVVCAVLGGSCGSSNRSFTTMSHQHLELLRRRFLRSLLLRTIAELVSLFVLGVSLWFVCWFVLPELIGGM